MGSEGEAAALMVPTTPDGWLVYLNGDKGGFYAKQLHASPGQAAAMCG